MATKNQPVKEVRLGRIKAVIWKNPGPNGNGPLFNTTLARLYKEPESDTWKESQSLGRDDLLLAWRRVTRAAAVVVDKPNAEKPVSEPYQKSRQTGKGTDRTVGS